MKHEKLSASMAALVNEYEWHGVAMASMPRAVPLAAADNVSPPKVFVFIRCDYDAKLDEAGVKAHLNRGKVRTALVSLDAVDRLTERDDVYSISPSRSLKPLNDVAALKTNLALLRTPLNLFGDDVIVGIVDSGIDSGHPAFAGRIHSIWDQTITGAGWGTTNYGTVLTGPTLMVSSDTHGHGTHVAGIAAGDDPLFPGVASRANLVIVKTNFNNTAIGDGIRYVFDVASRVDKPAVVNLSLGGHFDSHDGSDDLSELIDQESGPGRIVVVAAGNEGGDDIHAHADIPAGQTADIEFLVPPNSQAGATPLALLNGWYGPNSDCEISIETSSGNSTGFQPVITAGSPSRIHTLPNAVVLITTPSATSTPNGDNHFIVELRPGPSSPVVQGGTWKLRIRNVGITPAAIDCWSIVPPGARDVRFRPPFNSTEMKIGSPGAAEEAITVASYTTRNTWTDSSGANRAVGLTVDTISDFSSPGPLRNQSQKPDVAAPGAMIVSCLSSLSTPRPADRISPQFVVNAGTSMACPFISGLVALLLQRNSQLDPAGVKTLLKAHSHIPATAPGSFDSKWGFGLIDAGSL